MKITILTLFPKMIEGFFKESIVKRAQDKGLIDIRIVDLREYAVDDYGSVDDRPYGGGVGMVLRADVVWTALNKVKVKSEKSKVKKVITSPKGKLFNQKKAQEFSKLNHLVIIAGHYEGVDERVLEYVDEEISLGDFVMTGGEIAASAIVDSIVRLLPGVLKHEEATQKESFFSTAINQLIGAIGENSILKKLRDKGIKKVQLLEYPQYTRPEEFNGIKVPAVLLSGNHKEVEKWRLKKSFEQTLKKRPDLLV
ncbi:tRNA (guanosine(37)-N1)-methyltransferase TrmD [Candidatus Roizmanbacteria bacterium RIFCSPHIGHO2_01_FULL_39_8]|uniref:tRNA (guanine-N(1)-)-methyltransferase n=3 Tax=Candidatus Roizmaniibacteriota TaxID=1752723 RepID=A0A1F7GPM9_9BACT|nr:MAG: tRNA (guanosine(37)-N1)-methyltransferase TrmD [Candidatus Roizmanbacteria bacterium RIFCSPHIGHO2_01_FULL_39_8]OGK25638.1 MAG: tRNA (guanosine(37)-N1)-methyltransferase TrmD [Candidatus Roizmanbacteria bacterium RIFCSPHIGHO2_02_FULL_39_9]OGK35271.1 MAG: tRNA (guanosine(37)-N1)-methyltransferase TrmD [Candidatus Roizmanbacteria bacterium RIFCSPHIGHO2_12_FULL_39_8]